MSKVKALFFDTETTGTDATKHGIIQIAARYFVNGSYKSKFSLTMNPADYAVFDDGAMKWHETTNNITLEKVQAWRPQKEVFAEFIATLDKVVDKFDKSDKIMLFGYNVKFDEAFLRAWFLANEHKFYGSYFHSMPIDVASLAADALLKERHTMSNFKLSTVCQKMGIEVDESKTHDAMYDVDLTVSLYKAVKKANSVDVV